MTKIEEYVDKGQFYEALQILNKLNIQIEKSHKLQPASNYLKCICLSMLGKDEEALKLAENVYQTFEKSHDFLGMLKTSMIIAESLAWLGKQELALDFIEKGEKILKNVPILKSDIQGSIEATFFCIKAMVYARKGELDIAFDYINRSSTLGEKYGDIQSLIRIFYNFSYVLIFRGEFIEGSEYLEKALSYGKKGFNRYNTRINNAIAYVKASQGHLDQAMDYYNQALELAIKMNCKRDLAGILNNIGQTYHVKGDIYQAQEYLTQSLEILEKLDAISVVAEVVGSLFRINLDSGNIKQAEQYLSYLKRINNQQPNKAIYNYYQLSKALLLKANPRAKNLVKAEEILKHLIQEEFYAEISINVILHLCDLYLIELESTSNLELMDQIQLYINQILDLAMNQKLHSLLIESYLLEIKFDLMTLDLNKAQETLTKAQKIAEKYRINHLIERLAIEQEELINQKTKWLKLKNSDNAVVLLANLIPMKEQIKYMLKKRELFKNLI